MYEKRLKKKQCHSVESIIRFMPLARHSDKAFIDSKTFITQFLKVTDLAHIEDNENLEH